MHHQHVAAAQAAQHVGHQRHQLRGIDAEHLVGGAGGVGQRAEDVEQGAHAHLAARRHGVAHRRVVVGGEHEAHAHLLDAARHLLGIQVEVDAGHREEVGAARRRRHPAVAVLGDVAAGGGHHEARGGGDVEQVGAVAAGADDVDHVVGAEVDRLHQLAHHLGGGADLLGGLALHRHAHQEGGDLRVAGLAGHDLAHHLVGLGEAQVLAAHHRAEGLSHLHGTVLL